MKELVRISGFSRRTIHFYIQEGILHSPMKTGKTMSYYNDGHVLKLKFIKEAKVKGMTLLAIKNELLLLPEMKNSPEDHGVDFKIQPNRNRKPRNKRSEKLKGNTRNEILMRGCVLFREKGYKAARISDITRELGIGKGTFYFYFADKKGLLLECVPKIFSELFSSGWDKIRQETNPLKRLELRAQAVFPVLPEFCAIVQICKEAMEDADPELKRLGRETYLTIRKPLEADIEKGIGEGLFRPVDAQVAATMMIGIIENMYYLKDLDQAVTQADIWDHILSVLISGLINNQK